MYSTALADWAIIANKLLIPAIIRDEQPALKIGEMVKKKNDVTNGPRAAFPTLSFELRIRQTGGWY